MRMNGSFADEMIDPEDMAVLDENCEYFGLKKSLLMENAGRAIIGALKAKVGSLEGKGIVVVAGIGNNGGDGFVAARHAAAEGGDVSVILLGSLITAVTLMAGMLPAKRVSAAPVISETRLAVAVHVSENTRTLVYR
jgi:hydroxyethylthiazole kinase-like uncharacterized protein yjeF